MSDFKNLHTQKFINNDDLDSLIGINYDSGLDVFFMASIERGRNAACLNMKIEDLKTLSHALNTIIEDHERKNS